MATPLYGNAFLQLPEVEWGLDDEKFTRFTYIVRTVKHTVMPKKELPCFEVATTDFVQKSTTLYFLHLSQDDKGMEDYDLLRCVESDFEREHKCALPWRNNGGGAANCSSKDTYLHFDSHMSLMHDVGPESLYKETGCKYRCTYTVGLQYNKNRLCSMTCGIDKIYEIEPKKYYKRSRHEEKFGQGSKRS